MIAVGTIVGSNRNDRGPSRLEFVFAHKATLRGRTDAHGVRNAPSGELACQAEHRRHADTARHKQGAAAALGNRPAVAARAQKVSLGTWLHL